MGGTACLTTMNWQDSSIGYPAIVGFTLSRRLPLSFAYGRIALNKKQILLKLLYQLAAEGALDHTSQGTPELFGYAFVVVLSSPCQECK